MTIEVKEQDLAFIYNKAKMKYKECINYKDNTFLKDEVNIPLEFILLREKDIKIVFSQNAAYNYLLEVTLELYDGDEKIGQYIYSENEIGDEIDDILVFY